MIRPKMSQKRAKTLSFSLFFLGLAIISFKEVWWPGIMLVTGIPLACRQFLLGKIYESLLSLTIFIGTFIAFTFDLPWAIFLPILFVIAAIYLLVKEFFYEPIPDEIEQDSLPEEKDKQDTNK